MTQQFSTQTAAQRDVTRKNIFQRSLCTIMAPARVLQHIYYANPWGPNDSYDCMTK